MRVDVACVGLGVGVGFGGWVVCGDGEGAVGREQETQKISIREHAYTRADAHQSEYTPERDRRREYVSGFTGSAGTGG